MGSRKLAQGKKNAKPLTSREVFHAGWEKRELVSMHSTLLGRLYELAYRRHDLADNVVAMLTVAGQLATLDNEILSLKPPLNRAALEAFNEFCQVARAELQDLSTQLEEIEKATGKPRSAPATAVHAN